MAELLATLERPGQFPERPSVGRRLGSALLLTSTAVALAVRSYGLGRLSFWYDEGVSAYMAEAARLAVWRHDVHPPLYYALLALWRLPSDGDGWLRLLSVLLGVATVPVVYGLGVTMFNRTAGLWAATLLSVNYVHVQYSQEARMYALMVLVFAGALWGLVLGAWHQRRLGWVAYAACASMLAYSHGLGPVYVAILAVLFPLLARDIRHWKTWRPWLLAHGAIALLFVPWLAIYLQRAASVTSGFWLSPVDAEPPIIRTLHYLTVAPLPAVSAVLEPRFGLTIGRRILGRWMWFAPILFSLLSILARAERTDPRATRPLVAAYLLPIAALAAVSLILRPMIIPRTLLPTLIPVVLLLGSGVDFLSKRRGLNHMVLALIAMIFVLATIAFHGRRADEEWREMSQHLARHASATDLLLFDVDSWPLPSYLVARYDPSRRLSGLTQLSVEQIVEHCRDDVGLCLGHAVRAYPSGQGVWVVHSHEQYVRGHDGVVKWLNDHVEGIEVHKFAGILLENGRLRRD